MQLRHQKKLFVEIRSSLHLLERIACSVKCNEPVLLVGETGTGKTTLVQTLAMRLGQKLTVLVCLWMLSLSLSLSLSIYIYIYIYIYPSLCVCLTVGSLMNTYVHWPSITAILICCSLFFVPEFESAK